MKSIIHKLPQELVNQIAAGEVIERPASIVKELVDNSIDAGATKIVIKVVEGGINSIEVSDNGIGISQDDLVKVFEAHTTSKISSLEDLSNVNTMGFRGEALSTIVSVAQVEAVSRHKGSEFGYSLKFEGIVPGRVSKEPKEQGTTIKIHNLFYNVPARRKFLKTPETEYRKVLQTLIPIFMLYNNIHFTLFKNEKEVYNLPPIKSTDLISTTRVKTVLKAEYIDRMFQFKSEGAGVKIEGHAAHPKDNFDKSKDQFIFVNRRPIWDFGIAKSVRNAYARFIPNTQKTPFIISLDIDTSLVDVNVHPRKEEVRFENPFRIYSAVEDAVARALEKLVRGENSVESGTLGDSPNYNYTAQSPSNNFGSPLFPKGRSTGKNDIRFDKPRKDFTIQQSLEFSKEVIDIANTDKGSLEKNLVTSPTSFIDVNKVFQIFNKYIVIEHGNELITIDQHAAAERINFEKLERSLESKNMDVQNLLIPVEITLSDIEYEYISESMDFFERLGFKIMLIDNNKLSIQSIPSIFTDENIEQLFRAVLEIDDDMRNMKKSFDTAKENILATLACHGSIRKGQSLTPYEGIQIYKDLMTCKNTYSCPHGRPIIWKQNLSEIDTHFYRTY